MKMRGFAAASLFVLLLLAGSEGKTVNVVLVGATGNLAVKYLWQGLFNIFKEGLSSGDDMFVFPVASKPAEKAAPILDAILKSNITSEDAMVKKEFMKRVAPYMQLRDKEHFEALAKKMDESTEEEAGRLFYLSVPPKIFNSIATNINEFLRPKSGWLRVIVEKPFGVDLASAEELAQDLYRSLHAKEIFLIDHYMGKAGMHAIRDFHKRNSLHKLLEGREVKKIEVGMLETDDCKGRTSFYDEVGVIRDTMQNHLMMMLGLLAMNHEDAVRDEPAARKAVFEKLARSGLKSIAKIGQYADYFAHINEDRAEWDEKLLEESSGTPTYAHVVLTLDDVGSIFHEVPIHFKSGKALNLRRSFVEIHVDDEDMIIFNLQGPAAYGFEGALVLVSHGVGDFNEADNWEKRSHSGIAHVAMAPPTPFAYEVLLRAGLEGDSEHFVTLDEVLEAWKIWDPLLKELQSNPAAPELERYARRQPIHVHDEL